MLQFNPGNIKTASRKACGFDLKLKRIYVLEIYGRGEEGRRAAFAV